MAQATDEARAALVKAADDMARFYDAHWREALKYSVGDKVWLSSENIRMTRLTKKLDYKWLGPYTIDQVISCNAYWLKLPTSFGQVHPVFSVTLLCPYDDDPITECQEYTCHLRLWSSMMVSKNMKSKRFSTVGYSAGRSNT